MLLSRVNSEVEITVADSGCGIDAPFLPYVFDRFRQADSSTTRGHGGLGLGLSIVRHLVELHGGTIRAESAGEGKGATFIVSLPMASVRLDDTGPEDRRHPASADTNFDPAARLERVKVLVVDDESDARELIERVLLQAGAIVRTAASADAGLAMLDSLAPDVIISDIGMPAKDGYRFIREVRKREPAAGGRTPAIALTAFARSEDRTRAMIAGYQVHVSKPVEPRELIAAVASLTELAGSR